MKIPKLTDLQDGWLLKQAIEEYDRLKTIDVIDKMEKCQFYNDFTIVNNYLWEWHNKIKDGDERKKVLSMMLTCFVRMTCYTNSIELKTQQAIHSFQKARQHNSVLKEENEKLKKEINALKEEIEFITKNG